MSEVFAWPEGALYVYTGSHTASGNPIAYVQSVSVNAQIAWQSQPAVDGTYRAHYVDERADYSFQVGWLFGEPLSVLHAAKTAVHVKIINDTTNVGSAGIFLYSGVMPTLTLNGFDNAAFNQLVNGFAHSWSAF